MAAGKQILLVAQKQADMDDPARRTCTRSARVAKILQLLKLPDGTVKVLVEGAERAASTHLAERTYFIGRSRAARRTSSSTTSARSR